MIDCPHVSDEDMKNTLISFSNLIENHMDFQQSDDKHRGFRFRTLDSLNAENLLDFWSSKNEVADEAVASDNFLIE